MIRDTCYFHSCLASWNFGRFNLRIADHNVWRTPKGPFLFFTFPRGVSFGSMLIFVWGCLTKKKHLVPKNLCQQTFHQSKGRKGTSRVNRKEPPGNFETLPTPRSWIFLHPEADFRLQITQVKKDPIIFKHLHFLGSKMFI